MAASRYLGRANLAVALRSFMAEGVWGTSPHLIPHFALHSASGTISLALGSHGPNLGVGGGLHAASEGFLAALTLAVDRRRTRCVARLERLVAGAGSRPGWKCSPRWRMPRLWPWPWWAPAIEAGRPAFRAVFGAECRARTGIPRAIWPGWRSGSGAGRADRHGRSRPMRAGGCASSWSTGRMARDEAIWKRLNLSGLPASGLRPRWAASSRRSRQTCWPAGRAYRW